MMFDPILRWIGFSRRRSKDGWKTFVRSFVFTGLLLLLRGSRLGEQKRRTTRASVCVEMDGHLLGMDARALLVAACREEVG